MTSRALSSRTHSTDQLTPLREALLLEREEQEQRATEHQALVAELRGQADLGNALEREIAERTFVRASEAVADIDVALRRIEDGTYGTCERCDDAIASERLGAIPWTRYCLGCSDDASH